MLPKSPFNYIGNKHRIIDDLTALFPSGTATFVDLFCGGADVTINATARRRIANDINYHVIEIMEEFQRHTPDYILAYIYRRIDQWKLSKTNNEGFLSFRKYYNTHHNPLDLFVLVCFSFNYQFRFNSQHEFNTPFGKNRSYFSDRMKNNLLVFIDKIAGVEFRKNDFRDFDYSSLQAGDFLYADPPYTLTCGSYNDGKRGFRGWSLSDDRDLVDILDSLAHRGIRFVMSNVIEHKGRSHPFLIDWITRHGYEVFYPSINYNNCNYHATNRLYGTTEVLISNF